MIQRAGRQPQYRTYGFFQQLKKIQRQYHLSSGKQNGSLTPTSSTPATQTIWLLPRLHTPPVLRTLPGGGTPQTPILIIWPSPKNGYCTPGHCAPPRRFRSFMETPAESTRGAGEPLSFRPQRGALRRQQRFPPAACAPPCPPAAGLCS